MTNYQFETDKIIKSLDCTPRLLLHACCAPCSSYVLEYLTEYFDITVFFYNPNITEYDEYLKRKAELKRFISQKSFAHKVKQIDGDYEPNLFFEIAKGRENIPEGGARCFDCYRLRLQKTAELAKSGGYDYFCTTLSISPHKNAAKLNEIGGELSELYGVKYLYSDFKKRGGYKRSIELSAEYNLYRQSFCGCIFSKKLAEKKNNSQNE